MTAAATFDDLRWACATYNRAGRHEEALACAEEAWRRFPERRDFSWFLVAYANAALGRRLPATAAGGAAGAARPGRPAAVRPARRRRHRGGLPPFPPMTPLPEPRRRLDIVILHGAEDRWGIGVPSTVDALHAAGHNVHVEEVDGLGHHYPADFAERLPALLATAGITAP